MRSAISWLTFAVLIAAFLLGVVWFAYPNQPRYEPALTSLALLASITGIFVERWTAAKERRKEVLHALAGEFVENAKRLRDERFSPVPDLARRLTVYPRLLTSATDMAIASGTLTNRQDRQLHDALLTWRDIAHELNRRLDITEIRTVINPSEEELTIVEEELQKSGGLLDRARRLSSNVGDLLAARYQQGAAQKTGPSGGDARKTASGENNR